jgi:hydroxypyruvate isomerase
MSSLQQRRLAANLGFLFGVWPFLDRFAVAADAGFTAVEFLFPYDHSIDAVAKRIGDSGLEVVLFNCPAGDWEGGDRGLAALPGCERLFERSIETALAYARAIGTRNLHVMAGIADAADPLALRTYRRNLEAACALAAADGVTVLIEPINRQDMPGYFLDDFDMAASIVNAVPGLGLQFDLYHCHKIHGAVLDRLAALLPLVHHMQIAGVPDRHEPKSPALPLREIFSLLDRSGYPGRVGCEYRPVAGTLAGLDWIDSLEAECS